MEIKTDLLYFQQLLKKVKVLVAVLAELEIERNSLKDEITKYKEGSFERTLHQKIENLEEEIKRLKKENRILKEKENLVKNKLERLAVKLEEIDL